MSYKLLIVDDEANIISLLRDYLEINGYEVLTAASGLQALKQARKPYFRSNDSTDGPHSGLGLYLPDSMRKALIYFSAAV